MSIFAQNLNTNNMSFSDLFDSEFKTRNKGHFSAIVRVAIADGDMTSEEKQFLDKLKNRLEISDEEYDEILENPLKYPIYLFMCCISYKKVSKSTFKTSNDNALSTI